MATDRLSDLAALYNNYMRSIFDTKKITKEIDQRILLGFVLFVLIVSFTVSIFFIFMPNNIEKPRQTIIVPTKFLLHNSIQSVSPAHQSTNVGLYASISARFTNPVFEQGGTSLSLKPKVSGDINWSSDDTTIVFSPKESFIPGNTYEATLIFPNGKQVWQFKIISSDKVNNQDALRNQVESDIETAEALKSFYDRYPWWDRFPLKKENYFVYFHPEKKSFIGLLYPNKGTQLAVDQEVRLMKSEIEATIKSYNIDLLDYGISWKITPEL